MILSLPASSVGYNPVGGDKKEILNAPELLQTLLNTFFNPNPINNCMPKEHRITNNEKASQRQFTEEHASTLRNCIDPMVLYFMSCNFVKKIQHH